MKKSKNPMAKLIASYKSDGPEPKTIYEKYLDHTTNYQQQYGQRTIVLMMVGSFYEVYGLKSVDGEISGSEIVAFSQICQMNISEKKKVSVNGNTVLMAGFPEYTLERYLQKLSEAGFTSVVIIQDEENSVQGDKKKHIVHSIHSAGTFISYDVEQPKLSNNIMCVWLASYSSFVKSRPQIVYGVSVINIFTGKSFIFEHKTTFENNPTTFDELERAVSVYNPCEIILLYDLVKITENEKALIKNIKSYAGIDCESVHEACIRDSAKTENCMKQQYIVQLLETFFGSECYETCEEFSRYQVATQSFCYLLNFIQEHNPSLIKKIHTPTFGSTSVNAILANHTLKQLNIIEDKSADSVRSGKFSSVLNFLNRACTPIGKRRIQEVLTNPVFDENWLNNEYNMISQMLSAENYHFISFFRKQLADVTDLEKIMRQILVKKVSPSTVFRLHESVLKIQQIHICLAENRELMDYLPNSESIAEASETICSKISGFLEVDACKNIHSTTSTVSEHIVKKGVDSELDALMQEYQVANELFNGIHRFLNMVLRASLNLPDDSDYVKINTTEKMGSSLQITKTRAKVLKQLLDNAEYGGMPCFRGIFTKVKTGTIMFHNNLIEFGDLKFKPATTAAEEIVFDQLTKLTTKILKLEHAIEHKTSILYAEFVEKILENECYDHIDKLVEYVASLDVLQSKTYVAKENRYCRPQIADTNVDGEENSFTVGENSFTVGENSFLKAVGIRHCLIEHLQQNEIYVANDVEISSGGILLYGTNAVGKTSLIRAIGIATILAQCGFFVPCSKFLYKPYRSFYTRILGNDNLYKGLSTFGVEMSELRVILKNADQHSLILGDELCSGTETQSALSIFVAGLMKLHEQRSSFLFATHFHEIVDYEEITSMDRLALKHMAVHYDRELDCLVYDRLLKDGPGDNMYGLEVCKSLHLPTEFLDKAFEIRNKYFPEKAGTLSQKTSHYNTQKVRSLCELCKKALSSEIHHLEMQKDADADGFIGAVHKNHKANLMALCEECHMQQHTAEKPQEKSLQKTVIKKIVKKKTTVGYLPIAN
jgi:DNA mismatch repair protein MutS